MKTSKKILGVLLALAMLVNVFAVFSFAAAPDSAIDLTLTPDKASYSAGEVVTFTVSEKVIAAVGDMRIGGQYAIGYNASVIDMLNPTSQDLADYSFTPIQSGYDSTMSTVLLSADNLAAGDTIDEGHDWDTVTVLGVADDNGATTFDATAGVDLFTFQMKLSDTVADGDYVVGFNVGSYINFNGYANDARYGGVAGYIDEDPTDGLYDEYGTTANFGFVNATIHVGAPAASSILNPFKSQIRFDKNGDGTYAGTFDVRQLAVVSKADFEGTFGATVEAQKAAIAEVGFVFARTSAVATFDVEAAKALIENGTAATGYVKKTVDYITTNSVVGTDNYGFSCIVEDIPEADKADGINALAYIKGTDGTFHFYPAAEPTSFNDLHTAHYNSAFPA